MKNSNAISQKIILAISLITVAICGVLIYTAITNNAFGTEAEATTPATDTPATPEDPTPAVDPAPVNPQPNDAFKITFSFNLHDSCPTPTYDYKKNKVLTPFVVGKDSIQINTQANLTVDNLCGTVAINITDNSEGHVGETHSFLFTTPIGYEPTIASVNPERVITAQENIELGYKKYDGKYTIKLTVRDSSKTLISGYDVKAFLKDGSVAFMGTTDDSGVVTKEVPASEAICSLVGDDDTYSDGFVPVDEASYKTDGDNKFVAPVNMDHSKISLLDQVDIKAHSDSEHHLYFLYHQKQIKAGTGIVVSEFTVWKPYWNLAAGQTFSGEYKVLSDGSIFHSCVPRDDTFEITITPVSKDGTPLDHWTIDTGANGQTVYYPGDKFSASAGEKLFGTAFYEAVDPTLTAQTGDNSMPAVVALGILAASSAITLIYSRKRRTLL